MTIFTFIVYGGVKIANWTVTFVNDHEVRVAVPVEFTNAPEEEANAGVLKAIQKVGKIYIDCLFYNFNKHLRHKLEISPRHQ